MKKLNIAPYTIQIQDMNGKFKEAPYNVAMSIESIMLAAGPMTEQRLNNVSLLKKARVAEKIKDAEEQGFVLLEDSEFLEVTTSFKVFSGYGKNEVELCRRIEAAETVEVKEK